MVTDRPGPYVPQPVPSWGEIVAAKDREIERLRRELAKLQADIADVQRQQHVDLGRS